MELSQQTIDFYRENGFVKIGSILSATEVEKYLCAAEHYVRQSASYCENNVLDQRVNVWRHEPTLRKLTRHPRIALAAERLAGVSLKLWHDQLLIKHPRESAPTEFHQDQPYWPHSQATEPLTAWIALVDVPVERGCMSFIPGTHLLTDLPRQELNDAQSLFGICPELRWESRVTVPLRAGDCTFHHGRTAHYAHANRTNESRIVHAIIFTDANTIYTGASHVVTDPLQLPHGAILQHDIFPLVKDLYEGTLTAS